MIRIGIDLGGTKIEAIALAADGSDLWRRRVPTPQGDYDGTLAAIQGLVLAAEKALGESGRVGIGIPGSISPFTGYIRNANSTCLNGRLLHQDLENRLERTIRLENDANCLALSEATDGAGVGAPVLFAAILGTGVGGGLVVHGNLVAGTNRIAGEWGHSPLPLPDARHRSRRRRRSRPGAPAPCGTPRRCRGRCVPRCVRRGGGPGSASARCSVAGGCGRVACRFRRCGPQQRESIRCTLRRAHTPVGALPSRALDSPTSCTQARLGPAIIAPSGAPGIQDR